MFHYTDYITEVEITNRQNEISIDRFLPLVPFSIAAALCIENQRADFVAVQFLSDRTMRRYHQKYFQDPSATDCMSFPIDIGENEDEGVRVLGDIFVCPRVAERTAKQMNSSFEEELSLYLIHGTLHLLGYNDITDFDRTIMRKKEQDSLKLLKKCV